MRSNLRTVAWLVAAHIAASALHFADNALRFDLYHDEATPWLNPTIVVVAWFVQTAIGVAGLALHRRGPVAGRPILLLYGALGFAGFLHCMAPPSHGMDGSMHALIALEGATGLALVLLLAFSRKSAPYGTLK